MIQLSITDKYKTHFRNIFHQIIMTIIGGEILSLAHSRWKTPQWIQTVARYYEWYSVKAKDSHYFSSKFLASLTEQYPEILKHAVTNCCHFQPPTFVNLDLHNKLWQKLNTEIRWMLRQISDCKLLPIIPDLKFVCQPQQPHPSHWEINIK
jgi:hypothetical protein